VSRHPHRFDVVLATTTCLAVLLLPGVASALSTGSGGWQWQSPLPQGAAYAGGYFLNATHGWLIAGGDIFHTSDGGATLTVQARHNVSFCDITFTDAAHGWAVGDPANPNTGTGIIYRTTNGGRTWVRVPLHLIGGVNAVSFATQNVGWAVSGGAVLHTTDGGRHWTRQSVQRAGRPFWGFYDVQALSVREAWIGGERDALRDPSLEGLMRTTDGGATWKRVKAGLGDTVHHVFFSSPRNGWIAGESAIMHTSDGGAHWRRQLSLPSMEYFRGLSFSDSRNGWAASSKGALQPSSPPGAIYRTTDGGAHWVSQATTPNGLGWVKALTRSKAVVGGAGGFLSRTADGGASWRPSTRVAAGLSGNLLAVEFISAATGWAAGSSGEITKTSDGGVNWSAQASSTTQDVNDVDFIDPSNGWAVGDAGVIVHTADGGATWTPQSSGVTDDLAGVFFVDAQHGWAVGHTIDREGPSSTGVILATVDGGQHWIRQTEPDPAAALNDVVFADTHRGWAVGEVMGDSSGNVTVIFSTNDGGATWTTQLRFLPLISSNSSDARLNGIACIDPTHLVVVGFDDRSTEIWRTSDGGQTWSQFQFPDPSSWSGFVQLPLSDVVFADAAHGWAAAGSEIIRTTNGGLSWTRQTAQAVGPTDGLDALSFVSATRGWAVGSAGSILTTTTGGEAP
jgi:photosystem II stability/assembly factor-like uncharacterized protein